MSVVPPPARLPSGAIAPNQGSNPYNPAQQAQQEAERALQKKGNDSIADAIKLEQASARGQPMQPNKSVRAEQVRILTEREGQAKERKRIIRGAEEAGIDVEDWVALRRFIRPDREVKDTSWAKDACALVCNSIRRKGKGKGKVQERDDSDDEGGLRWRAEVAEEQPSFGLAAGGAKKGLGKGMHPPAFNKWFGIDDDDEGDNRSDLTGTLEMRGPIPEGCPQPSDPNEPDIGKLDDVLELLEEPFTPMVQLPIGKLKVVARLNNIDVKNCVEKGEVLAILKASGIDDEKANESLNMCPDLVNDLAEQIRSEAANQGQPEQVPEVPVRKKKKWKPAFGVSVFQKGHEIDPSAALAVAGFGSGLEVGGGGPESPDHSSAMDAMGMMGGAAFPVGLTPQEAAAHVQAAAKVAAEMFLSGQAAVPGGVGGGTGVLLPGASSPSQAPDTGGGYTGPVILPPPKRTDAENLDRKGKPARVMAEYYK